MSLTPFAFPWTVRNTLSELETSFLNLNEDVLNSAVSETFKGQWKQFYEGFGAFYRDSYPPESLDYVFPASIVQGSILDQADRYAVELQAWRDRFAAEGGKITAPAPAPPGEVPKPEPQEFKLARTLGYMALGGGLIYLCVQAVDLAGTLHKNKAPKAAPPRTAPA